MGGEEFGMMRLRLWTLSMNMSDRYLLRQPLINRNRVLIEVEDHRALDWFLRWIVTTAKLDSVMGKALHQLLVPLGGRILLLGGHFIIPKVTEYAPQILQQVPHTDVHTKGEVIGVGLHLNGEPMNTLVDPNATLDSTGQIQGGSGFLKANTNAFAFDTGAVHAGPGSPRVDGPFPRFFTSRIFFLLCSATLTPTQIAKHRSDNALVGHANLVFDLPPPL